MSNTQITINDHGTLPDGEYVAALRLYAYLGVGEHFAGPDPRSAWTWVVRLPDGTHGSLTFLVNHARRPIRMFSAALTREACLMDAKAHCDAHQIIGRSAVINVVNQVGGDGKSRPSIVEANELPVGIEPIPLTDARVWTPESKRPLPPYAPQWVRNYAVLAGASVKRNV